MMSHTAVPAYSCAVAVIGGGITGLTTGVMLARRLGKIPNAVAVIEGSKRTGGWMMTTRQNIAGADHVLEHGVHSVRVGSGRFQHALDLVCAMGLDSQLVWADKSSAAAQRRCVGCMHPFSVCVRWCDDDDNDVHATDFPLTHIISVAQVLVVSRSNAAAADGPARAS
jgi:hypothetical protein